MLSLRDLTYTEIATRIILSVLFGGILGMERGMKNRGAGLRTYMLVCLGSCVVMMTNQFLYQSYQSGDPARLGAQVINGIGFLGAGTIIVTKRNQIKGLTTAAGLWTSAGLYEVAAPACLSIFVIFTVLHELDFRMRRKSRQIDAFVELRKNTSIRNFLASVREQNFDPSNLLLQPDSAESVDSVTFTITLKSRVARSHEESMCLLRTLGSVSYIEEL